MTDGRAERLRVLRVSSGYFSTLRSPLRLGRDFDRDDETGTRRVVLSDTVWRTHFGANPSIVGTTIRLSGEPYEVAGVAPPGFEDPIAPDVAAWIPYALARDTYEENNSLTAIGRLRNGVTLEQAQAELATLTPPMQERWPAAKKSAIVAMPLHEELVASARGAAAPGVRRGGARSARRLRERRQPRARARDRPRARVRRARRAGLGPVAARAPAPGREPRAGVPRRRGRTRPGGRRNSSAAGARSRRAATARTRSASTRRADVRAGGDGGDRGGLRDCPGSPAGRDVAGRSAAPAVASATGTRGLARLRGTLAAAQVALALTLVAGAGVLLASFHRLQQVDLGVRVDRVLTFEVNLPTARYDEARRASFQEELAGRLETIPGVTAAGGISRLPATGSYHPWNTQIRTGPLAGTPIDRSRFAMQQRVVSGDLFAAFGIPVLAGRSFDVATMRARRIGPSSARTSPGSRFPACRLKACSASGSPPADGSSRSSASSATWRSMCMARRRWSSTTRIVSSRATGTGRSRRWSRPSDRRKKLLSAVRDEVARLDPELVVHRPAPMAEVVDRGTSRERFALVLMGAFAVVALALAALGLYGVLAYAVRQRSTEIGIRIALGATAGRDARSCVRQAAAVVGLGIVEAGLLVRWCLDAGSGHSRSGSRRRILES